jgi:hypothetical protein
MKGYLKIFKGYHELTNVTSLFLRSICQGTVPAVYTVVLRTSVRVLLKNYAVMNRIVILELHVPLKRNHNAVHPAPPHQIQK